MPIPTLPATPLLDAVDLEAATRQVGRNALFDHLLVDDPKAAATLRRAWQRAKRADRFQFPTADRLAELLGRRGDALYGAAVWDQAAAQWEQLVDRRETRAGRRPPHGTDRRYSSRAHPCRCQKCRAGRRRAETDRRARARLLPRDEATLPPHGTVRRARHSTHPCRDCAPCVEAMRAYSRDAWRRRHNAKPFRPWRHGTYAGYQRGCRNGAPCPATPSCWDAYRAQRVANLRVERVRKRRRQTSRTRTAA